MTYRFVLLLGLLLGYVSCQVRILTLASSLACYHACMELTLTDMQVIIRTDQAEIKAFVLQAVQAGGLG